MEEIEYGKEEIKTLERRYKMLGTSKWYKDTPLIQWEGETTEEVIKGIYSGTNFRLHSMNIKKINNKRSRVYQILEKK